MVDADELGALPRGEIDLPIELRALRDCESVTWQLERMVGVPVVARTVVAACVAAGREVSGASADLLALQSDEAVVSRAVLLAPLFEDRRRRPPIAHSRLWLAADRVPDQVVRYLGGTNLTLGQVLTLVSLPMRTRRDRWWTVRADAPCAQLFGCPVGAPGVRRRMVVLVDGERVAVTEETFYAGPSAVRRGGRAGRRAVAASVADAGRCAAG